jgi:Ca-activated chloride channel family protein
MSLLSYIQFEDPLWLLGLIILPFYWYYFLRKKRHETQALSISYIKDQLSYSNWKTVLAKILPILKIGFFLFGIVTMARPQMHLKEEKIKAEGIDIFMAMDLSSSMLSKDFEPDRLSVSKRVAAEFVSKRPYDRIGLASFAGEAYTQSPLTTDHAIIQKLLSELQCGYLKDGTAIGMGLATSINRLKDSEAESKVVILLTDGVNNSGYIEPITAAEIAREMKVTVYTIGVGSMGMAYSPIGRLRNGEYRFARTRVEIDDQLLTEIAEMTGGSYFRATNEEDLLRIYDKIDELEKTEIEVNIIKRTKEYYYTSLGLAFACLMLYLFIKYQLLRIWPD